MWSTRLLETSREKCLEVPLPRFVRAFVARQERWCLEVLELLSRRIITILDLSKMGLQLKVY